MLPNDGTSNPGASDQIDTTDETDRMIINGNGYVGIGTVSPSGELHVIGNIYSDGDLNFNSVIYLFLEI